MRAKRHTNGASKKLHRRNFNSRKGCFGKQVTKGEVHDCTTCKHGEYCTIEKATCIYHTEVNRQHPMEEANAIRKR